jgi:hypothetical protein
MGDTKLEPDLQKVLLWVEEIMIMVLAEDKCASSTSAALDEIMPRSVVEETNIMRRTATLAGISATCTRTLGVNQNIYGWNKVIVCFLKILTAICAFFPHSRVRRTCESDKPLFCQMDWNP